MSQIKWMTAEDAATLADEINTANDYRPGAYYAYPCKGDDHYGVFVFKLRDEDVANGRIEYGIRVNRIPFVFWERERTNYGRPLSDFMPTTEAHHSLI